MANYGTSPLHYRRKIDPSDGTAQRPLDAFASQALLNNGLHLADESAQTLVAWSASLVGTGGSSPPVGYLTPNTGFGANTPSEIVSWPINLRLRETGVSYPIRIRIGGAAGNAGTSTFFYATITSRDRSSAYADLFAGGPTFSGDHIYKTASTSSTTAAWLTGASNGTNAWSTFIRLDALRAADWLVRRGTLTDIGGSGVGVPLMELLLVIWGQSASASFAPRLYSVYAAEYVGL